jgi:hypothetical protein
MMGLVGAAAGCSLGWAALRLAALGSAALGPLAFALRLPLSVIAETLGAGGAMGLGAAFILGQLTHFVGRKLYCPDVTAMSSTLATKTFSICTTPALRQ